MAEFHVSFDFKDIVDRLKEDGWVRPVRCCDCEYGLYSIISKKYICGSDGSAHGQHWYCAGAKRRDSDE